ncbi:hypothetical protein ACROYT_G041476 [Oculina patagonica]
MNKFSSSLVFLCLVVSVLLLACTQDGDAVVFLPPGSINSAKRSQVRKSEMIQSRRSVCEAARALKCAGGEDD